MKENTGIELQVLNEEMFPVYDSNSMDDVGLKLMSCLPNIMHMEKGFTGYVNTGLGIRFGKPGYAAHIVLDESATNNGIYVDSVIIGSDNNDSEIIVRVTNKSGKIYKLRNHVVVARLVIVRTVRDIDFVSKF